MTLNGAAAAGGAVVALFADAPASVPASITVAAGAVSATFTVTRRPGDGRCERRITATGGGVDASATLSIGAPAVSSLALRQPSCRAEDRASRP